MMIRKLTQIFIFYVVFFLSNAQNCPPIQLPLYGEWPLGQCSSNVNDRCLIGCQRGFELLGSSHRSCCGDGTWTGQDTMCINRDVQCPPLSLPPNGLIIGTCMNFAGSLCTVECSTYFQNSPVKSLVFCYINGSWSSLAPQCTAVTRASEAPRQSISCPDVTRNFFEGSFDGECALASPGQRCSFSCQPGFALVGKSTILCTTSGQWDSPLPRCTRLLCPSLAPPINGSFIGSCESATVGDRCQFICNSGSRLIGSNTSICLNDGTWTSSPPVCSIISCPPLPSPSNGYLEGQCNPGIIGFSCSIRCNECFAPTSANQLYCRDNGQWSGVLPQCRQIQCPDLPMPPPIGSYEGSCSPGICGQTCVLNCGLNYQPSMYRLQCRADGWNPNIYPRCTQATCPVLPPIENGIMEGNCSPGLAGRSCSYRCNDGYALAGETRFVCDPTGNWTFSKIPSCSPVQCPNLLPPTGGQTTGMCSLAPYGGKCIFTCNLPLNLIGESTLICQNNGRWSSPPPTCAENPPQPCTGLSAPSNGKITGNCNPGITGRTCTFLCGFGYTLIGKADLVCGYNGLWDNPVPQCALLACPSIKSPENGLTRGDCSPGIPGNTCSFSCDRNYRLAGPETLQCQGDGAWSGPVPSCVPNICISLPPPEPNGGLIGICNPGLVGQSCSFICPIGYRIIGPTNSICLPNGSWSNPPPYCQLASCPTLTAPQCGMAQGTCSPGVLGYNCSFTCSKECSMVGSSNLTCLEDGKWSDTAPECRGEGEESEEPIATSESVTEEYETYAPTSTYPNEPGGDESGGGGDTGGGGDGGGGDGGGGGGGESGGGQPGPPCNSLAPPMGGVLVGKCAPGVSGAKCSLVCSRGFQLLGSTTVICTPQGFWTGRLGSCRGRSQTPRCSSTLGCCDLLKPPRGIQMVRCSNQVGSKCKLVCPSGYRPSVTSPIICKQNQQWSYSVDQLKCVPTRQNLVVLQWSI